MNHIRRRHEHERASRYDKNPGHGNGHSVRKIKDRVLK